MLQGITLQASVQQTVQNILMFFATSVNTYYLTGSRFFGNNKENSDWDFFTVKETKRELESMGFKPIPSENLIDLGYDGSQFVEILELKVSDGVIQVQLVKNINAKFQVQESIKSRYLSQFNSMDKHERKELWSLLLLVFGKGEGMY